MIINFSLENFRSIKDEITLSFEATNSVDLEDYYIIEPKKGLRLLKLGLLFGANASGKTTVLRGLNFLKNLVLDPFEKKTEKFDFKPFLFDNNSIQKPTKFSIEFFTKGIKYLYKIELNDHFIVEEKLYYYNPKKALVYQRNTDSNKQLSKIEFGSKIKINKEHKSTLEANTLWNNTVLGGFLKTNFESKELQDAIDWFGERLRSMITPDTDLLAYISSKLEKNEIKKNNIVEFLKKADFKISDIIIEEDEKIVDKDFIDFISKRLSISEEKLEEIKRTGKIESKEIIFSHLINDIEYRLPYDDESQGTQRYYQFSGLLDLMISNGYIFPIDELESSLHPDLLKHFLLSFLVNSKSSQLLATTHHRELLMEKDIFRNDVIWFTEKGEKGNTELYSLIDFDSSVIRNTSSVFNAYKIGKLGALPELSDHYFTPNNG